MTTDTAVNETPSATQTLLKKKTATTTKVKTDTSVDVILTTANVIENLNKEESIQMATSIIEEEGQNDFRLGGVLRHIRQNGWYEGYANFDEMVDKLFNLQKRKAAYLSSIYETLVDSQIPWNKVSTLGWTKLIYIAPVLTPENVDEYVAKFKDMTVNQIKEVLAALKQQEGSGSETSNEVTSTVSTLTFKVHTDQKDTIRQAIDKAKSEVNTDYDTVAIESICIGFLGGSVNINKVGSLPDLTDIMKTKTLEEVLAVFELVFPDVELTVTA